MKIVSPLFKIIVHCNLYYHVLAPAIESFSEFMKVMEGDGAVLKVVVTGDPDPNFLWHYEGTQLMSNISREILSNGSLVISSTTQKHSGAYKLIADNCHGTAETEFKLLVVAHKATLLKDVEDKGKVLPVNLDIYGEYVQSHHFKSNKGFKKQFLVHLTMLILAIYVVVLNMFCHVVYRGWILVRNIPKLLELTRTMSL